MTLTSSIEPIHLMSEHEGPLGVSVVSDYEAFGLLNIRLEPLVDPLGPHDFEYLGRLAPRRGAHVKHGVVSLDAQEQRGQHADYLLPGENARVVRLLHEFVDFLKTQVFLEELAGNCKLKKDVPRRVVLLVRQIYL
jgi:hypothetical protein